MSGHPQAGAILFQAFLAHDGLWAFPLAAGLAYALVPLLGSVSRVRMLLFASCGLAPRLR